MKGKAFIIYIKMKQIPLSKKINKKNQGKFFALVDDSDFDWLNQFDWHPVRTNGNGMYASRKYIDPETGKILGMYMHREIMGVSDRNTIVDHIDRCGLNCQRINLRTATLCQNNANRRSALGSASKYLGVCFDVRKYTDRPNSSPRHYWRAVLKSNNIYYRSKRFSIEKLGSEQAEILAAKCYDELARIHHKEFANLNFK